MVFGYPGTTSEYVPSFHIDMIKNYVNPKMIEIRTRKIEIMESAMNSDPLIQDSVFCKEIGSRQLMEEMDRGESGVGKNDNYRKEKGV